RADEEFEAFLLEVLSDFQVTIPEVGTVRAEARPSVVLTSNRARDLSDALRRRCLYLWIDYPSLEKELRIVRTRIPGIDERLAREVTAFIHSLRRLELSEGARRAAGGGWGRCQAWPSRWTGHGPWWCSTPPTWTRSWSGRRWAASSRTRR